MHLASSERTNLATNRNLLKKLIYLLAVMAVISIIGAILCVFAEKNGNGEENDTGSLQVVTSFYPMYILTGNLLKSSGATVYNMTTGLSGCIHDYQVTTDDMKRLTGADVFVVNGMGMESFLSKVAAKIPNLTVFAASGVTDGAADENGHLWMNPRTYLEELDRLYSDFSDYYEKNGMNDKIAVLYSDYSEYREEIQAVIDDYEGLSECIPQGIGVICYNEAFEPYAIGLGMDIIAVFSLDEDETPSAGEVADCIEKAKNYDTVLIFIEEDLAYNADKVVTETGAETVFLNPLTSGSGDTGSYTEIMTGNISLTEDAIRRKRKSENKRILSSPK